MKDKMKIILSYDYELFFGSRSGTIQKTIIEPTNKLMTVMEQNGFRGNFFVDYLMFRELEKLTDERARSDLKMLKAQILDMVRRGHRIELHLHPHWIDARYNGNGTWNFDDFTHYSLSSLNEEIIVEMFKLGVSYLTDLIKDVDPTYKIVAFRAGGWAVQPFSKLRCAFLESGIKIDSSTSYGIYNYKADSYYDFCIMPNKAMYSYDNDVCIEKGDGQFVEIPITSFHRNLFFVIIDRVYGLLHYFDKKTDGTHDRESVEIDGSRISFIDKLRKTYKLMFTLSMHSPLTIQWALYQHIGRDVYCCIDHPKDLSKATLMNINMLGKFCQSVNYVDYL